MGPASGWLSESMRNGLFADCSSIMEFYCIVLKWLKLYPAARSASCARSARELRHCSWLRRSCICASSLSRRFSSQSCQRCRNLLNGRNFMYPLNFFAGEGKLKFAVRDDDVSKKDSTTKG